MSASTASISKDQHKPQGQQASSHGRHTSWSGHKSTSDGDILTLDSPTGNSGNSTEKHVRSLSGHLFGMHLSPDNSISYSPEPGSHHDSVSSYEGDPLHSRGNLENRNGPELKVIGGGGSTYPTQQASENVGRKHRRGVSSGKTHPVVAHRRINSGGNAAFINRHAGYESNHQAPGVHHISADKEQYPPHDASHHNQWPSAHQRRSPPYDSNRRFDYHPGPSPYDERERYGDHGQYPRHPHSLPNSRRTSPIPQHQGYEGMYRQPRQEDFYNRGPPRYHSQRSRSYSPHEGYSHGPGDHLRASPDPYITSSYSDEGSSSSNAHPPATHNNPHYYPPRSGHPAHHPPPHQGYYPPPRGPHPQPPYPVQYSNSSGNEKRYMSNHNPPQPPPPDHPLAAHEIPTPEALYRRTSGSTVGSEGMIETDEKLFSGLRDNQTRLSSSPRISPQLFDAALRGNSMPRRPSPPGTLHASGMVLGDSPRHQSGDSNHQPTFASAHNRVRSSSSDPQMKQFISAIESSQTHRRGSSSDSFVFDGNLFGENILEPTPIETTTSLDLNVGSPGAPIPAISAPGTTYDSYSPHPVSRANMHLDPVGYGNLPPTCVEIRPDPLPSNSSSPALSQDNDNEDTKGRKHSGAAAKRTRRKCSIEGCTNRVVQGGLCISHGAKRKLCGHPGCTKHVKKAGMCSAHGPPRKLCEFDNCPKVAVQGGRCIAHGAKKKLCSLNSCKKQAILGGMCKKHHDQHMEAEAKAKRAGQGSHRRGLSIDDMNTVNQSSIDDGSKPKASHTRGLSIFTDTEVVEKIITKEINL